jgi:hypothetical protein
MSRTESASTPRLIGLALLLLTLAIYWPVLRFDFVNYDDDKYVNAKSLRNCSPFSVPGSSSSREYIG